MLTDEERTRFLDHLLAIAQAAPRRTLPLLRRQAVYLLGFDWRQGVLDWLRAEWQQASRLSTGTSIAALLEARSASVALAALGETAHIHDFVESTGDEQSELANMNYWANWVGEFLDDQHSDDFMVAGARRGRARTCSTTSRVVCPRVAANG